MPGRSSSRRNQQQHIQSNIPASLPTVCDCLQRDWLGLSLTWFALGICFLETNLALSSPRSTRTVTGSKWLACTRLRVSVFVGWPCFVILLARPSQTVTEPAVLSKGWVFFQILCSRDCLIISTFEAVAAESRHLIAMSQASCCIEIVPRENQEL